MNITACSKRLYHRPGTNEDAAIQSLSLISWLLELNIVVLASGKDFDPIGHLNKGRIKLHPLIGLYSEATLFSPDKNTSFNQDILWSLQG